MASPQQGSFLFHDAAFTGLALGQRLGIPGSIPYKGEEQKSGIRRRSEASAFAKAATADRMTGQEQKTEIPVEKLKC